MREVLPVDAVTRTAHVVVGLWGRLASLAPPRTPRWATIPPGAPRPPRRSRRWSPTASCGRTPRRRRPRSSGAITYGQQIVEVAEPADLAAHLRVLAAILSPWRA
jgi:hypothetical protein